ncbi:MAG: UDP-N-acetylglucosamine 2-epimerase (non-hydrolyzing) [Candidatus Edwardsbacteria bacterium]|jgi:UDP-N-acetylglucosamine 2-epimerase (non-hydrolysing)|nr:UDP-N-acetylglucosamine 2-epimerase (non-hydrolyzing) [Candidatus Edwardsbacteria bacterium]
MERSHKVILVGGARPNFPKLAPLLRALAGLPAAVRPRVVTVHTGQHYDELLSRVFFRQLGMPRADHHLGAGSGTHAQQSAAVLAAFERVLQQERPSLVVVVGDVNSTMAAALAAVKLHVPVAHVEAGLRSFDRTMPEEINRVVTDHLADLLFTHCADANDNLRREGIAAAKVHYAGNVMIDSLRAGLAAARRRPLLGRLGLERAGTVRPYALATLHRPANVDDRAALSGIVAALAGIAKEMPVLWPAHPRAQASLKRFGLLRRLCHTKITRSDIGPDGLYLMDPLGYLDFIKAEMCAACVFTDSGGVQEETTWLGVPCFTVRPGTERPVTIALGTNRMAGVSTASILRAWRAWRKRHAPAPARSPGALARCRIPGWDGRAAQRIAAAIARYLDKDSAPSRHSRVVGGPFTRSMP